MNEKSSNETSPKEVSPQEASPPSQQPAGQAIGRNDPAIDPQVPGQEAADSGQGDTGEPTSADPAVDQKNHHSDNDNAFSPGFKPQPDRPQPGDRTDHDIGTDGG